MALLALQNNFDQEVPEGLNMDSCEVVQKVQGHASTFWMIDQFLITVGFEDECESLTLLGV